MKSITILIFLFPFIAFGQQTDLHALVSQGGFDKSHDMSLSWTLGELFTETIKLGNTVITQGFQQPYIEITRLHTEDDKAMEASLFPNPTRGWLTLKMETVTGRYRVEFIDMTGRILSDHWHENPKVLLDISVFPSGSYIVRISSDTARSPATYNVLKF